MLKVFGVAMDRATTATIRWPGGGTATSFTTPATSRVTELLYLTAGAAALAGIAELTLSRVIGPVVAHIPSAATTPTVARAVTSAGQYATAITAVLILMAAFTLIVALWRDRRLLAAVFALAVSSAAILLFASAPEWSLVGHLAVIATCIIAVTALGPVSRWYAGGVAALAVLIVAGQVPLLLNAIGARGWFGLDAGAAVLGRSLAETAMVVVPIAFVAMEITRRRPKPMAWLFGGIAAAITATAITVVPDYTAILSVWAAGVTLSLPPVAYILAAGCVGVLLATWLPDSGSRHLAAALVLVLVAGLQPVVVHHNITALVALLLFVVVPRQRIHLGKE